MKKFQKLIDIKVKCSPNTSFEFLILKYVCVEKLTWVNGIN